MPCATLLALMSGTPFTSAPVSNFRYGDTVRFQPGSSFAHCDGKVVSTSNFPPAPGTAHVQVIGSSLHGHVALNVPEAEIVLIMHNPNR